MAVTKPRFIKIDDERRESGLDDVAANAPDDWLLQLARAPHAGGDLSQTLNRENVWQTAEKIFQR